MAEFESPMSTRFRRADQLIVRDPLDLTFQGFAPEAFVMLDRLRLHPRIENYRQEKEAIRRYLTEPFKRYRDDLVVNWVLPSGLPFETEKNVFSRLLKNDFGAGGCHHHLWMSFYRPARRRLTDVQLMHSIWPDRFNVALFVGAYMKDLLKQVKQRIEASPSHFLELLNPLLHTKKTLHYEYRRGGERIHHCCIDPLETIPDDFFRADSIWVTCAFARDDVVDWEGTLVKHTLGTVLDYWPLYRFFLG